MSVDANLLLIDMAGVREGDPVSIRRVGDAIRQACGETGFSTSSITACRSR